MTAIPVPSVDAQAADINDSGVVVGTMKASGGLSNNHAWVYQDGVVTNLNSADPKRRSIDRKGASIDDAAKARGHRRGRRYVTLH